jgi:GABA(A) receptor-associated protein
MEKIFNSLYPKHEKSKFSFKNNYIFDKRFAESNRIRGRYPDRIPIICQRVGTNIPKIDKSKYLVPGDLTFGQFMYVIRKRIKLEPEMGLYMFVGEGASIPNNTSLISRVYDSFRDKDGFLYINYSGENTFG